MHRLQISLTENQYEFLKSESFVSGRSMAAVLRDIVDQTIHAHQQQALNDDPIWEVIGIAEDVEGPTDVSTNVDKYLYGEALASDRYPAPTMKAAEEPDEYNAD
jgi:hypothetical protein